jgi:hypothetical protein
MSRVELVFDEAVNYGTLAHTLVSDKHNFEFNRVLLVGGVAQLLVYLCAHILK